MQKAVVRAIDSIAADNRSGAMELADQGANVLIECARVCEAATTESLWQDILFIGKQLIQAQPAMAPLVNLVNTTLWNIEKSESPQMMRTLLTKIAHDFKRRLRLHEAAIAEAVVSLVPEGASVLTYSRSSTVRGAILHLQRTGRHFKVICAEARPGYEGRMLARELAASGVNVTLLVDGLAFSRVEHTHVILVGADHLDAKGLINKAGTAVLAKLAHAFDVPLYALCSSEKFLPSGYMPPSEGHRPTDQVWDEAPTQVQIENYYFDRTPLDHVAAVVTERGTLTAEGIEGWLASTRLHPALAETLQYAVGH